MSGLKSLPQVWSPWLLGLVLSIALTGGLMQGWFCLIDDHWRANWLGPSHHLPVSGIWPALMGTEVGTLGADNRFKPIFYLHATIETAIFGEHVGLYYALRIVYFATFLGASGWLAARVIGPVMGALLMVGLAGWGVWINLWTLSLGATEQIAIPGITLLILAYGRAARAFVEDSRLPRWTIVAAAAGTGIAAGAKENFQILLLPFIVFVAVGMWKRRIRVLDLCCAVPFLAVPALVLYDLWQAHSATADYYGVDNSVVHRLAGIARARVYACIVALSILCALLLSWIAWHKAMDDDDRTRRSIFVALGVAVIANLCLLWEIFFYNDRLPAFNRYDFPSMLLPLLTLGGIVALLHHAMTGRGRRVLPLAQVALVLCAFIPWFWAGPIALFDATMTAIHRTRAFHDGLLALRLATSTHPDWPIVIEANAPWDYEAISEFHRWQRYMDIGNPVLLRIEIPPGELTTEFENALAGAMRQWSMKGVAGRFEPLPTAARIAELGRQCFVFATWRAPVSDCRRLDYYPQNYIPH